MWPRIFFSVPSDILLTARLIRKCIIPLNDEWVDIEPAMIFQIFNSLAYYTGECILCFNQRSKAAALRSPDSAGRAV